MGEGEEEEGGVNGGQADIDRGPGGGEYPTQLPGQVVNWVST